MKIEFTRKDKLRIAISLAVFVIGVLIIGAAFTPWMNPPQCEGNLTLQNSNCIIGANIGAGLVWLLGMAVAILGGIALTASLLFVLVREMTKKPGVASWIAAVIVGSIIFVCWYIFIGASSMKKANYQKELQKRHANFVEYKGTPNIKSVSGQSTAVNAKPTAENPTFITLDYHNCSPGAAQVSYGNRSHYFAFSGVRKDPHLESFNASECVFYIGPEITSDRKVITTNQPWDGLLHIKCVWDISDNASDNKEEFRITDNGIHFKLRGLCTDLRTGIAPGGNY